MIEQGKDKVNVDNFTFLFPVLAQVRGNQQTFSQEIPGDAVICRDSSFYFKRQRKDKWQSQEVLVGEDPRCEV